MDPQIEKSEMIRIYVTEFARQLEENYLNEK